MSRVVLLLVVGGAFFAPIACGGRTAELDVAPYSGTGGVANTGGRSATGGAITGGHAGTGGFLSTGGCDFCGGGYAGGSGGYVGGSGGYVGGAGGYVGGAGGYYTGGFGGDGGYAGSGGIYQGSGGFTGPACAASFCPLSNPGEPITLQGCCTYQSTCGIDTTALTQFLPVQSGCQDRDQPGYPDASCAPMPTPLGTSLPGCCTQYGVCGNDLSALGLGCVISLAYAPGYQSCGFGGAGGASSGGVFGGGGTTSTGGTTSAGGTFPTGGTTSAGGVGGASAECLSEARSDCERCACSNCGDSFVACFRDAGCPEILKCANQTGCSGVDCYQPSTCQSVIDQTGGLSSPSLSLAFPIFSCVTNAGCPCGFK